MLSSLAYLCFLIASWLGEPYLSVHGNYLSVSFYPESGYERLALVVERSVWVGRWRRYERTPEALQFWPELYYQPPEGL